MIIHISPRRITIFIVFLCLILSGCAASSPTGTSSPELNGDASGSDSHQAMIDVFYSPLVTEEASFSSIAEFEQFAMAALSQYEGFTVEKQVVGGPSASEPPPDYPAVSPYIIKYVLFYHGYSTYISYDGRVEDDNSVTALIRTIPMDKMNLTTPPAFTDDLRDIAIAKVRQESLAYSYIHEIVEEDCTPVFEPATGRYYILVNLTYKVKGDAYGMFSGWYAIPTGER